MFQKKQTVSKKAGSTVGSNKNPTGDKGAKVSESNVHFYMCHSLTYHYFIHVLTEFLLFQVRSTNRSAAIQTDVKRIDSKETQV